MPEAKFTDPDAELSDEQFEKLFEEGGKAPPPPTPKDDDEPAGGEAEPESAADKAEAKPADGDAKPDDPDKDKDWKSLYQNMQQALKAERAQARRLDKAFEALVARQRAGGEQAKPERPAQRPDPLADMPQVKDKYDDPLEELEDHRKFFKWFANRERNAAAQRERYDADALDREEKARQRDAYLNDVAQQLNEVLTDDQRGDIYGEDGAFRAVLDQHAGVIYSANLHYLDDPRRNLTPQDLATWAQQQAYVSLHRRIGGQISRGQDPAAPLMAEAERYGWRSYKARQAESAAAAEAKAKKDAAEAALAKADTKEKSKREDAREVLSASLSSHGRSDGGGVQSLKDLADAMDSLDGDEFDSQMDRLLRYAR